MSVVGSPEENERLLEQFEQALQARAGEKLEEIFLKLPMADAAEAFEDAPEEDHEFILKHVQPAALLRTLPHLPAQDIETILQDLPPTDLDEALQGFPIDDLTDFLQALPSDARRRYLSELSGEKGEAARRLLKHGESTAGGRMTTEFTTLSRDMTLGEAIASLKAVKEETEVLSRIYVVDEKQRVVGKVRLRDLTFNDHNLRVADIMLDPIVAVFADADQEEAAQLILKHDMMTLPVVNNKNQLIGVITHDDAMEILLEESTEDLERQSAIAGQQDERDYLETPFWAHFRRRYVWVLILAFLAIGSGYVILSFEEVLDSAFVLAVYLPMVVAAGGNTGAQAATTVIRAMSLDEVEMEDAVRVLLKELTIGLGLGLLLGLCIGLQIMFFFPGGEAQLMESVKNGLLSADTSMMQIALTVAISLTLQLTSSTFLGAALPLLAKALKLDPAVVASPAITTIVDITGMIIYFGLAKILLGL